MYLRALYGIASLYFFLSLLFIDNSEAVTPSKCQEMMAQLSCSGRHNNSFITTRLSGLVAQIENMTGKIEKSNSSELEIDTLLKDLIYMNASVRGLLESVHNMSYSTISQFINEDYKYEGGETGRLHIGLLCLWIDVQTLTRNLSVMSTIQNSAKLAINLKISDLTTQIVYLQQHVLSTNENLTLLSERVRDLETNLSSQTREGGWNDKMTNMNHTIHNDHLRKLAKLKTTVFGKDGAKDPQSTLNSHVNSIPEIYEDTNKKTLHELIEMMEDGNLRLLNLSLAVLRSETELETMRRDFSRRLATLEEKSASQRAPEKRPHTNKTDAPSAITHETCNGARRHLVGDSCYYMPLVRETDSGQTWWDSRYLCKREDVLGPGADLVAIESKREMNDIIRLITNHFGGIEEFWLGGNDLEAEGHWQWVMTSEDITDNSYINWGQPLYHSPTQNCMSMLRGFKWAAEPCFYQRHPICELKLNTQHKEPQD